MTKGKIGLLPLYLKLYDDGDKDGGRRRHTELLPAGIAAEMEKRGFTVVTAPVCRIQEEFIAAVKAMEAADVDALVTLHLAYSPSLESAAALAGTRLPIIVLDTTPTFSYGPAQDPDEMMFNHGIHGVQDMCNLLLRNGKAFSIEAGHWQRSDVLDRVAALVPAARIAACMRGARVGAIGGPFTGMGDFAVTPARLAETIGAVVKTLEPATLKALMASVKDSEVEAEIAEDLERFRLLNASPEAHRRSVKMGLAIRRWIETEGLAALTFNFMSMERKDGYITAPFLEMSKAMGRGTGYAGEGDTLTAVLVAALLSVFPDTSFTEMFCPDWENDSVFLSHMGEVNWRLLDGAPVLREMRFAYTDTDNPALVTGRFKPGKVALVNLAPGVAGNAGYRLIVSLAEMLPVPGTDRHDEYIHGWIAPSLPVADFLARYSRLGGTHHLAVSYTTDVRTITRFGEMMGWEVCVIG